MNQRDSYGKKTLSRSHANEANTMKAKNILKERMKSRCDY